MTEQSGRHEGHDIPATTRDLRVVAEAVLNACFDCVASSATVTEANGKIGRLDLDALLAGLPVGDAAHGPSDAFEQGLDAARQGVQELTAGFDDLAFAGQPEAWSEKPFARIVYVHQSGDPSVGIPAQAGWSLAEDQAGTVIADLATLRGAVPEGTLVSMDVSTGDEDALHRVFGRVCEVMTVAGGAEELTVLAIEESRNFSARPAGEPEGWQWAPKDPTEEMIRAGCLAQSAEHYDSYEAWWDDHSSGVSDRIRALLVKDYQAMLAKAPPAGSVHLEAPVETCENNLPDCGPVTHHDSEGVPLCELCWQQERSGDKKAGGTA